MYVKLNESSYWCITVVESYLITHFFFSCIKLEKQCLGPNVILHVTKHLIQKSDIIIRVSIFLESMNKLERASNGNVKFKVNMTSRKY